MKINCSNNKLINCQKGIAQVEQVVLIVTVAIGFAAAAVVLGSLLLNYHQGIELILGLPIP